MNGFDATRRLLGSARGNLFVRRLICFDRDGAADQAAIRRCLATQRAIVPVANLRGLTRESLVHNRATAPVEVDPREGRVTLAGRTLAAEPTTELPLNRRYLLR